MRRRRVSTAAAYAVLAVLAVAFLLPFWVIVRNAFSTQGWILSARWHWFPDALRPDLLVAMLTDESVGLARSMLTSAVVSVLQTVLTVAIAMMAGYALARNRTRASGIIHGLTLFTLMVPSTVVFVPTFVMVSSLGWISTFRGLVIPGLFSAIAVFLFRSWFRGFPVELEEAAELDGASVGGTFLHVVVPNSLGIAGAVGTITFIGSWNAFLWPLLIAQDPALRTVQVTLAQFMTTQGIRYPEVFTGALVAVTPALVVFLFLQRWLVQGVEQSGIR